MLRWWAMWRLFDESVEMAFFLDYVACHGGVDIWDISLMQLQEGGFRDKPGKHRDYYHTCYCLSGLSVAQYAYSKDADSPPLPKAVFGPYSNLLEPIHPLYNVILDRYHEAHKFFSTLWASLSKYCLKYGTGGPEADDSESVFVCFHFRRISQDI